MRAAIFSEFGGPEVIRVEEVADPEPGPGEVRLRVRAASLNHLDLWARRGLPFPISMPHIGGSDIAGEVERVGPGAEHVPIGTRVVVDPSTNWEWYEGVRRGKDLPNPGYRVIGEHLQGGFAELAVVPAANLLQIPADVTYDTAAAAGMIFATAWGGLMGRASLRPGERVLVTGGSGGVSTAAIQVARRAGASVVAVTSGPENVKRVRELGADIVLDRLSGPLGAQLKDTTGARGVDVVFDSVGQPMWASLIRCLRPGGRLVCYGSTAGPEAVTDLRHVFWKRLSILGTTMASPAEFVEVMHLVFEGRLIPVIDRVLRLEELGEAHRALEAGEVFGKVVIRV